MGIYRMPRSPFWWYSFKYNGKRIRRSTGLVDRKQAGELYHLKRGEYILGKEKNQLPPLPLKMLLETYLKDYSKTNKLSYNDDCSIVRILNNFFGERLTSDITPHLIERYKSHRRQTLVGGHPLSGAKVNRELAILKTAFNKGTEWGLVLDNPVRRVKFFSEKNRGRTRYLTQDEKKRLLDVCPPFIRRIVLTALKTGMRQAEILNLKWTEVDLNANRITLRKTKSGKIRHIPIHPDVLKIFRELPRAGEYVFFDKTESRSWHGRRRGDFEAALEEAGIRDFRFHDLRHSFASELVMKGVDIKTVSELLGHSTTRMTERYSHLSPSHKSLAINTLPVESDAPVARPRVLKELGKSRFESD
ncbi:MAG: site-specific integrase [bacterium]